MAEPYKLSNETVRTLCNREQFKKLDPSRLTRDHQIIACHYGTASDLDHLMKNKNLHHDAKFYISRYGNLDRITKLHNEHQPLDDRTQKQLKATAKLHMGDGEQFNRPEHLAHAQKIWQSVSPTLKGADY